MYSSKTGCLILSNQYFIIFPKKYVTCAIKKRCLTRGFFFFLSICFFQNTTDFLRSSPMAENTP